MGYTLGFCWSNLRCFSEFRLAIGLRHYRRCLAFSLNWTPQFSALRNGLATVSCPATEGGHWSIDGIETSWKRLDETNSVGVLWICHEICWFVCYNIYLQYHPCSMDLQMHIYFFTVLAIYWWQPQCQSQSCFISIQSCQQNHTFWPSLR